MKFVALKFIAIVISGIGEKWPGKKDGKKAEAKMAVCFFVC